MVLSNAIKAIDQQYTSFAVFFNTLCMFNRVGVRFNTRLKGSLRYIFSVSYNSINGRISRKRLEIRKFYENVQN